MLDDLWGADAVNTRRNTLQSKVARLRRALGEPAAIAGGDGGYRLARRSAGGRRARGGARCRRGGARSSTPATHRGAAELSAAALARFRGDVLPAAGDGDWVAPHRARLDEARVKLVETRLARGCGSGRRAT